MRADLEGMQETTTRPPLPLPPRPDLGGMFPPGPDHVLGTDFYVPEPRAVLADGSVPGAHHAHLRGRERGPAAARPRLGIGSAEPRVHVHGDDRRRARPVEPVRADPLRGEPGHGAPGVAAGRAGRRAPALGRDRDRVHVRRADGRGPDAVPRRVPTRPVRRSMGARPHRLGRSTDEHLRLRSGRSRGGRRRRAALSRPGAADDLRERRRRDQRRRSRIRRGSRSRARRARS